MKSLRVALIAMWLGAIIFFAIAVAPNVFAVLGSVPTGRELAGDIVQRALAALHSFGIGCGVVFLLLGWRRLIGFAPVVVLSMVLLTCLSQFVITPQMHALRMKSEHFATPLADADLEQFNRLHKVSTTTEGAILLLGILVVIFEGRRRADRQ